MATLRNRTPDRQGRLGGLPRGNERRADRLPSSARSPPDLEAMADDVGRGGDGCRRHGNSPQAEVPHERQPEAEIVRARGDMQQARMRRERRPPARPRIGPAGRSITTRSSDAAQRRRSALRSDDAAPETLRVQGIRHARDAAVRRPALRRCRAGRHDGRARRTCSATDAYGAAYGRRAFRTGGPQHEQRRDAPAVRTAATTSASPAGTRRPSRVSSWPVVPA